MLAVSAAVPTIAFSGVTDIQQEAWDLVDGLAPAYGDHWWYISLLAFTRQDQSRFDEAGLLAESALSCEPSSGHAVHAQTHVLYETGQHETGRVWLDHWVDESGRAASHRAHFSWHAALHELAIGDTEAVRRRYYSQLAPPTVSGVRVADRLGLAAVALAGDDVRLGRLRPSCRAAAASSRVLAAARRRTCSTGPETPFVALHAALALAAVGDLPRLAAPRRALPRRRRPGHPHDGRRGLRGPRAADRGAPGRRRGAAAPTCCPTWRASAARPPSARSSRRRCCSACSTTARPTGSRAPRTTAPTGAPRRSTRGGSRRSHRCRVARDRESLVLDNTSWDICIVGRAIVRAVRTHGWRGSPPQSLLTRRRSGASRRPSMPACVCTGPRPASLSSPPSSG